MDFVTTNIRLGAESYRRLKLRAVEERKSLAHLIRDAVTQVYGEPKRGRGTTPRSDPAFRIIGLCATGIKDGAVHHDRDIYGVRG